MPWDREHNGWATTQPSGFPDGSSFAIFNSASPPEWDSQGVWMAQRATQPASGPRPCAALYRVIMSSIASTAIGKPFGAKPHEDRLIERVSSLSCQASSVIPLGLDREAPQLEHSGSTVEGNAACIAIGAAEPEADQLDVLYRIGETVEG